MLTYLERAFLLAGVPSLHVAHVRLGYLPAGGALLVLGLGLLLGWQFASRRDNLHEVVSGVQLLLFGATVTTLGYGLDQVANALFLVLLFAVAAAMLLALFNFRGMGNISIRELRVTRRQAVGYALTIVAAIAAFLVIGAMLPGPPPILPGAPFPLQISDARAMFFTSGLAI